MFDKLAALHLIAMVILIGLVVYIATEPIMCRTMECKNSYYVGNGTLVCETSDISKCHGAFTQLIMGMTGKEGRTIYLNSDNLPFLQDNALKHELCHVAQIMENRSKGGLSDEIECYVGMWG